MVVISQSTAGWYTAASRVTCADVQCQDGLTKQKVMMHAGSSFKFQSLAQFAELQCKAAYKVELVQTAQTSIPLFYYLSLISAQNSRDCPQLKLSCATFDIPCNSTEVSVFTQCGGGHRMRWVSTIESLKFDIDTRYNIYPAT